MCLVHGSRRLGKRKARSPTATMILARRRWLPSKWSSSRLRADRRENSSCRFLSQNDEDTHMYLHSARIAHSRTSPLCRHKTK